MTPQQLQQFLARLFKHHGVELLAHEDWLLQGGTFPALRASWHERPEGRSGRLDVEIIAGPGRHITESFAGVGGGEAGCKDALHQFVINDLHVLLAAFWNHPRPEEVTIEQWEVDGQPWTAYIGNFGSRSSTDEAAEIPNGAFIAIEAALKKTPLAQNLHWVRTFYCNIGADNVASEALLDNQPWPAGDAALNALDWQKKDHYYSVRHFMVLKRVGVEDFTEAFEDEES